MEWLICVHVCRICAQCVHVRLTKYHELGANKKKTQRACRSVYFICGPTFTPGTHTHAIGRVGQHKHSLTAYGFNSHPTVQVDLCVQKKNVRGIRTLESVRFEPILSNPRSSKADRNNTFIRLCASLIAVDWGGEFENINIYQHQSGSWIVDVILIILLCCSYQW